MSGGISAGTMAMMAATAAVSMQVAKASAKAGAAPIQAVADVVKPPTPQAAAAPDQQAARQNAASSSGGYGPGSAAGTLLTGPAGVDPGGLLLGKNKLLGQ